MYNNYKNPFTSFNTNGMASEQISELFTAPFEMLNKTRQDITSDKSSIVFLGSRGTGKTMLLRQFSYNVQRIALDEHPSFWKKVNAEKFIGIYFRVDNALIKSLDSMGDYVSEIKMFSEKIFTHYFELTIFKDFIEIIKIFFTDMNLAHDSHIYETVIVKLAKLIDPDNLYNFKDIDGIISYVVDQINYVWSYQSKKSIDIKGTVHFEPDCNLILQGRLTNELLNESIFESLELNDINALILIDEFENFSEGQQRVINTAMRFSKENSIRYRIGMRPYGFKTYGTLDDTDFVKVGRDYQEVELGFPFVGKGSGAYISLVRAIANKRLSQVSNFNGIDIESILGKTENLEEEARLIVKDGSKHISDYLKLINKERKSNKLTEISESEFYDLRDDNPLFEMENLLLLLRGYDIKYVKKAFVDYKNKTKSEHRDKYSNDYDNKYKLSFVFILCTIYSSERKGYYGFKDYCQLSSGIIGHFIELCRRAFDIAYFKDRESLFNGEISPSIQTEAAYEASRYEREMIIRINNYGRKLETFIDKIGNVFSCIHKDKRIRYPETNLFPVSGSISDENKKLLDIACMWSLIIKKPNMQDADAKGEKKDIYFINRMFAPAFKISYRTRGGLNPVIVNDEYFTPEFNPESVLVSNKKSKRRKANNESEMQLTLESLNQNTSLPIVDDYDINDHAVYIDVQEEE